MAGVGSCRAPSPPVWFVCLWWCTPCEYLCCCTSNPRNSSSWKWMVYRRDVIVLILIFCLKKNKKIHVAIHLRTISWQEGWMSWTQNLQVVCPQLPPKRDCSPKRVHVTLAVQSLPFWAHRTCNLSVIWVVCPPIRDCGFCLKLGNNWCWQFGALIVSYVRVYDIHACAV